MRVWLVRTVLACALLLALVACGSKPARVSDADRDLIFTQLYDGKPFSRQTCGAVAGPLPGPTDGGYAAMVRVAAQDPDAELTNPDDPNDHAPIRTWVERAAQVIGFCRARVEEGPGWLRLERQLRQAAE